MPIYNTSRHFQLTQQDNVRSYRVIREKEASCFKILNQQLATGSVLDFFFIANVRLI